jgi:hypothetical protein
MQSVSTLHSAKQRVMVPTVRQSDTVPQSLLVVQLAKFHAVGQLLSEMLEQVPPSEG